MPLTVDPSGETATPTPMPPTSPALPPAWLRRARAAPEPWTRALAGVIALAPTRPEGARDAIRGLGIEDWAWLAREVFEGADLHGLVRVPVPAEASMDEFDELVALLGSHATPGQPPQLTRCLAHAVATACLGPNHLWQDLGFEDRAGLGDLMRCCFAPLKARNAQDMRWKKFFYRSLCESQEVLICKSPSCAACTDQPLCFGVEAGQPLLPSALRHDAPSARA